MKCHCRLGIMSQCVADGYGDQKDCKFFDPNLNVDGCMWRHIHIRGHCTNPSAQAHAQAIGEFEAEIEETLGDLLDQDTEEIDVDSVLAEAGEEVIDLTGSVQSCKKCKVAFMFCPHVDRFSKHLGRPLNESDLDTLATMCLDYEEDGGVV